MRISLAHALLLGATLALAACDKPAHKAPEVAAPQQSVPAPTPAETAPAPVEAPAAPATTETPAPAAETAPAPAEKPAH